MNNFWNRAKLLCASIGLAILGSEAIAQDASSELLISKAPGAYVVTARGRAYIFRSMNVEIADVFDDRIMLVVASGGSSCPSDHYWLDLSGKEPILSESFGDCSESLSVTVTDNGKLVAKSSTPGARSFVYEGGETVEVLEYVTPDIASARPLQFDGSSLYDLMAHPHWRAKLADLIGEARISDLRPFYSGPGAMFERSSQHWVALGCGRGMCSEMGIAVAVEPKEDTILVALHMNIGQAPFFVAGEPSRALPAPFARFLVDKANPSALKRGFESLSSAERMALQRILKNRGAYSSSIDGKFGRRTATGLVEVGITTAHEFGVLPNLQTADGVSALARRLLARGS